MKKIIWPRRNSLLLMFYDLLIALFSCFTILYLYLLVRAGSLNETWVLIETIIFVLVVFSMRLGFGIYNQIWRFGDVQSYLKLMIVDGLSLFVFYALNSLFFVKKITFTDVISLFSIDLMLTLSIRIVYRYCYKYGNDISRKGKLMNSAIDLFSFGSVKINNMNNKKRIPVAILGSGKIGVSLANEFFDNKNSIYELAAFLENDPAKIGRVINDVVLYSEEIGKDTFDKLGIQEVIFTVDMPVEKKQRLYQRYKSFGLRIKTYDMPQIQSEDSKKAIREFDIEELLFRKQVFVVDDNTKQYYKNKVILITGGGGSIGSEMARQVAKMDPRKIVLLDIYENGVYDIQQELRTTYHGDLDLCVEIANVCDEATIDKIFSKHEPNIVIHAAAHKHVPLMENNVCEAINNNIFGTLNIVKMSEKHKVERFIMVSTDKAVNPTNVMGATKRVCEMIAKSYSTRKSSTTYSMTRFGNVLGSAGSVIPMFKRQIAAGGPITITDKRIIRYFMTIPEASQLVLKSGAMAKNGELFVLDMGQPVKILDLAENLVKLSGLEPYKDIEIKEIGLRPGEKLYEELLIKSENLKATSDKLIFIENDQPLTMRQLSSNLASLKKAVIAQDDVKAKAVLKKVVPTFKNPGEVNKNAKV